MRNCFSARACQDSASWVLGACIESGVVDVGVGWEDVLCFAGSLHEMLGWYRNIYQG